MATYILNNDGTVTKTMASGAQYVVSPDDDRYSRVLSEGGLTAPKTSSSSSSGSSSSGSSSASTKPSSAVTSGTDYSLQGNSLMANGADWRDVLDVYNARMDKIQADPSLAKYANDQYSQDMLNYIITNQNPQPPELEEKPVYNSPWMDTLAGLASNVVNRQPFSYNALNDPMYQQYAASYAREGERAMADTLADAAAQAGGMNSYAVTAAQQAQNYYGAQLADKVPELYQLAYQMYLNDANLNYSDMNAIMGLENMNYGMYRDDVGDYQWDANYNFNKWAELMANSQFNKNLAQQQSQFDAQMQLNKDQFDKEYAYTTGKDGQNQARDLALSMLELGQMPDAATLETAGISKSDADKIVAGIMAQQSLKSSGGSGGSRSSGGSPKDGGGSLSSVAGELVSSWVPSVKEYYDAHGVDDGRRASAAELYYPSALAHLQPLKNYGASDAEIEQFAKDMVSDYIKNGIYQTGNK